MSANNRVPVRRRLTLVGAAAVFVVVAVALTVTGRYGPGEVTEVTVELSAQEVADVKAAVEKVTQMPVRHVGRSRQGVVEVFVGAPREGRAAYRVKKTAEGWQVVEVFLAFSA